jgi:holo-[acyl-carrier protein] synthase
MRAATTPPPRARTGCDLQRIEDVTDAIRTFGDRYLDRVYTPAERAAYRTGGAASLAARFAAKEAVLKLIGTADGVDPRSVEITTDGGRPAVRLSGLARELAERARLGPIDVSLSHSGDHAIAVAVAVSGPDGPPDPLGPTAPRPPAPTTNTRDERS